MAQTRDWGEELRITGITVRSEAVDALVLSPSRLRVGPVAAALAVHVLPNLPNHVCVSGDNKKLGEELLGTEPAHLLEHVAIELMLQAALAVRADATYVGHTAPAQSEGVPLGFEAYVTTVSYDSDLVAVKALTLACGFVVRLFAADAEGPTDERVEALHDYVFDAVDQLIELRGR